MYAKKLLVAFKLTSIMNGTFLQHIWGKIDENLGENGVIVGRSKGKGKIFIKIHSVFAVNQ